MEEEIEQALEELLTLIAQSDVIKAYKKIEKQARDNQKLNELVEEIKAEQKNAVKFAHYGKPVAEQEAIKRADALTKEFDEHPLVVAYRAKLIEANDLLQHLTNLLEKEVNVYIELAFEDALVELKGSGELNE